VDYTIEGANVGYKWFAAKDLKPQFAFGHGLSYTRFAFSHLEASTFGPRLRASFVVTNTGDRPGAVVPQLYLRLPSGHATPIRLAGWRKIGLTPDQRRQITIEVEPKTLADFDPQTRHWKIAGGRYTLELARAAGDVVESVEVTLPETVLQ
jgi:beta-glucosidase